jgi:hypothetical protein
VRLLLSRLDDLIPIPRRYATERVQYDVIVLDRVILESADTPDGDATPATMVPPLAPVSPSKLQDIVTAGGIDISDIVASALTAKLAVGAVLTYRQSWFHKGWHWVNCCTLWRLPLAKARASQWSTGLDASAERARTTPLRLNSWLQT